MRKKIPRGRPRRIFLKLENNAVNVKLPGLSYRPLADPLPGLKGARSGGTERFSSGLPLCS